MPVEFTQNQLRVEAQSVYRPPGVLDTETVIKQTGLSPIVTGSGVGEGNQSYHAVRQIAAGSDDDLDLFGVLTNRNGETIQFAAVKRVVVVNRSTTATIITVANTGGNWPAIPWQAPCGPNNSFVFEETQAGITVTDSTGDTLRITNTDGVNVADYEILIEGVQ